MRPDIDDRFLHDTTPFGDNPVLVVGQASVDEVVMLDGDLAIDDQTRGTFSTGLGGTAAILAHNLAALGGTVALVGQVGCESDDEGVLQVLRSAGVDCDDVLREPPGLRVVVLVAPDGSRTMISNGARVDWTRFVQPFPRHGITYFEGWHLFDAETRDGYVDLIRRCASEGSSVILDVCSAARAEDAEAHAALLAGLPIDVLLANQDEAVAYDLIANPPGQTVVVHRERRSTLLLTGGSIREVFPMVTPAVDTTGAGDTFAAGLLCALQRHEPLDVAVAWGHAAARRVVRRVGPLLPVTRPSTLASKAS